MRPLSPLPIALASAALAGLLWSFDALDDLVGGAAVVWVSQMLAWLGIRGPAGTAAAPGPRAALAIGGAIPTAACALTLVPWLAGGGGMEALGAVVGMIVFGVPLCTAIAALAIWKLSDRPRAAALTRTVTITASTTGLAWLLALAWIAGGGGRIDAATLLAFPGLATWWLVLPLAELLGRRHGAG